MFHNSKRYGNNVPWSVAEKFGLIEGSNEQPTIEDFYAADHVRAAQETLSGMSVREIQQKWRVSAHSAWGGKKAILDLPLTDQEAATIRDRWKPESVPSKAVRKCDHGNWQHQDDRGGFLDTVRLAVHMRTRSTTFLCVHDLRISAHQIRSW